MSFSPNDISRFLVSPRSDQAVRYGQARLTEWNPETFQNSVLWRGGVLRDVPVLGGADALTYRVGDTVGLLGWAPGKGAGSWAIVGRWLNPDSGRGEEAVDFLATALGQSVAAGVFAALISSGSIEGTEATTSTSWTDLATPGPTVTATVGSSGRVLVVFSAEIIAPTNNGGGVGCALAGANDAAAPAQGQFLSIQTGAATFGGSLSRLSLLSGLNPGLTEFTAKYISPNGGSVSFGRRNITVIGA